MTSGKCEWGQQEMELYELEKTELLSFSFRALEVEIVAIQMNIAVNYVGELLILLQLQLLSIISDSKYA